MSATVSADRFDRTRARVAAQRPVADPHAVHLFARKQARRSRPPAAVGRPGERRRARRRSTTAPPECPRPGCSARCRVPSSSTMETPGCSRPAGCARCTGSTARAAGSSDPIARAHRGTNRCAPSRASAPPRGARRRSPRRSRPRAARRAAPCVLSSPQHLTVPRSHGLVPAAIAGWLPATRSSSPSSAHTRSRNSYISWKLEARVDVQDGERDAPGMKRLLRQAQQHRRILADRIHDHGPREFGRDLAEDVDALRFEAAQYGKRIVFGGHSGRSRADAHKFSRRKCATFPRRQRRACIRARIARPVGRALAATRSRCCRKQNAQPVGVGRCGMGA